MFRDDYREASENDYYFTMHTNQRRAQLISTGTFDGPKVSAFNEYSATDGDMFPYRIKYYKL
jgi:tricorn protease